MRRPGNRPQKLVAAAALRPPTRLLLLPLPTAEPAGYDPDNKYADPVLYFKHREAKVAEEFVKVAEAKVRRWSKGARLSGIAGN